MMKKVLPFLFLFLVTLVIAVTNYTPGTWLSGWDNLHPEFSFKFNINRSLFALWQEYQGLGLLGGMGHASDLLRQVFLWGISWIVPMQFLRYFYHFLMVFVGMTGVYVFLRRFVFGNSTQLPAVLAALTGSLFYLLNLGTIQYFYVPFEPYSTFWGFFPWEIFALFLVLFRPTKKHFLLLAFINLLATPQGYVQTIFLVYLLCVVLILGIYLLRKIRHSGVATTTIESQGDPIASLQDDKKEHSGLDRSQTLTSIRLHGMTGSFSLSLKIIVVILAMNAFWLLPNLYFVATNLAVTQNAMQNRMATEKFFQMNKYRGTLLDFPLLREFYYDFFDYNQTIGQFDLLMKPWRNHIEQLPILVVGYLLFGLVVFGLFQKHALRWYILGLFGLCLLVFLSDMPGISMINDLFRKLPLVNQIFRNPFTKFIVPTVFVFAVGLSLGVARVATFIGERGAIGGIARRIGVIGVMVLVVGGMFFVTYPAVRGQFISPSMRVKIPKDYFSLFSYFDKVDKNARIMNLPQGSFWGWDYYRWGYRGSGFLWYGIEQPILHRAFDVWSSNSEDYYWQLSYALKKRDMVLFNDILEKYQVSYIIFDDSLLFTEGINTIKAILHQEDMLQNNPKVVRQDSFGSITVYKVNLGKKLSNNLLAVNTLPTVQSNEPFQTKDTTYQQLGYYQTPQAGRNPEYLFPFGSLFTNRFGDEQPQQIKETADSFVISASIPKGVYTVVMPSLVQTEEQFNADILARLEKNTVYLRLVTSVPVVTIDGKPIQKDVGFKDYALSLPSQVTKGTLLLSVNNRDYFALPPMTSTFAKIGTVSLRNVSNASYFRIYTDVGKRVSILPAADFLKPTTCGGVKGLSTFSSTVSANMLTLQAKNTAICALYKETITDLEDSLVQVTFAYKSKTDEFPQFCLFSQKKGGCLNKKDANRFGFANSETTLVDTFESGADPIDFVYFDAILEALSDEDLNQQKEITYKDITISLFPYVAGTSISLDQLQDFNRSVTVNVVRPETIAVTVPKQKNSGTYTNFLASNLYKKNPLTYDKLFPGMYQSIQLEEKGVGKFVKLEAKNTSSYLLLRAPELPTDAGYIVEVKSRYQKGLPIIANIFTNEEYRNFVYTFVPKKNAFTTTYYVLPPLTEFDKGVSVLLGASSFGNDVSIDDISEVSIHQLPYAYISSIYLQSQSVSNEPKIYTQLPLSTIKRNLGWYQLTYEKTTTPSVLVLSQSYHSGWGAYQIQSSKFKVQNWLGKALPFVFGTKLGNHVVVNGWENGWDLPETKTQQTIAIVYWPQYIEYVGFAIGALCLVLLILRRSSED